MTTSKSNEFSTSIGLVVGLLIAVGLIYLFIFSMAKDGFGKNMDRVNAQLDASVIERIKPVVTLAELVGDEQAVEEAPAVATAKPANELYNGACAACHNASVAGAPKFGDAAAWEPRYANGLDALVKSAIAGKGAMPPKGGTTYSDEEIRRTIEYMLTEAGLI